MIKDNLLDDLNENNFGGINRHFGERFRGYGNQNILYIIRGFETGEDGNNSCKMKGVGIDFVIVLRCIMHYRHGLNYRG